MVLKGRYLCGAAAGVLCVVGAVVVWCVISADDADQEKLDIRGSQLSACMHETDYGPLTDDDAKTCFGLFTGDTLVTRSGVGVQIAAYTDRWPQQTMKTLYDSLNGRIDRPDNFPESFELWWDDLHSQ
jgi:hypothetical protein